MRSTPAAMRALLGGELSPSEAIGTQAMRIAGDPDLLERFAELFSFDAIPEPQASS